MFSGNHYLESASIRYLSRGLAAAVPAAVLAVDLASVTADVCDNQKAIRGSLPIQ